MLRTRGGGEAEVSQVELFFDLVYVFSVTQLSHRLLENLTGLGAIETLVLWFAVWLGWQYTCWVTNWFNPDAIVIRLVLFGVMLLGLVMATAIPEAFGARGLVFAGCYAALQIGRTLIIVLHLGSRHALAPNFRRMLGWLCIAGVLWIAGGLSDGQQRLLLWSVAVACEYLSPMTGFWLPGLGRSQTSDWTIEGGHLAERCQLFVIVALGESILVTGATLSGTPDWHVPTLIAFFVAFVASVAMWWVYFNTSSRDGREAIIHSRDPGRIGAYFHYVHVTIVAGVIVSAVANELWIAHPEGHVTGRELAILIAGPAIYLLGNGIYKTVVYDRFPLSHLVGLAALAMLIPFAHLTTLLWMGTLTTLILMLVAVWETLSRRAATARKTSAGRTA